MEDLAYIVQRWLTEGAAADGDGFVEMEDYAVMSGGWGGTK